MLLFLAALAAQSFQITAPAEVSTGDLVSLRVTRDGAPLTGVALRVTAPAAEIARVTAARVPLRDGRTTLFKGDDVLVTSVDGAECGVLLASGAAGVAPCEGLERRAFGQPLGTTDADGRVLTRDLALVPAAIELAAVRDGVALATATVQVKPFAFDETSPVGTGITSRSRRWVANGEGPFVMHTVEVDPARPETFLLPVRARDRAVGLEGLTSLARRHGALVTLSGAAFAGEGAYAGAASGPYVWNGRPVAAGESAMALFVCAANRVAVQAAALRMRAVAPDGKAFDLTGLNRARGENEAVLYTPLMGDRTLTGSDGAEAVLDPQDRLRELRDEAGNSEIPFDGRVVSGQGSAADFLRSSVAPGAMLRIETTAPQGACAASDVVPSAIGAPDERRPRAAFSVTDRGTWLLSVVDGNQAATAGMRQEEFERELTALGATANVFLTSGGASAMAVGDALRSTPSAGEEQPVGDALLVFQVSELADWIKVLDRIASEPGQVSAVAIEALNAPLSAAVDAYRDGDPGGVRMGVLAVRDLIGKLDGLEITNAGARVMLRATEAFLTTLPDVQPLRRRRLP